MAKDAFDIIGEPTRRRILDRLRCSEAGVGELVNVLGSSQPAVSKHLKVLRDGGFVSSHTVAQQRIYRIEPGGFAAVDEWLRPYRRLWERHLDPEERQ